jgi:uncharacterized OB-fold protein
MSTTPTTTTRQDTARAEATGAAVDPRPQVTMRGTTAVVASTRCVACGYPTATALPHCPVCGAPCQPAQFGPGGTVFSATVLRIPIPGRTPPFTLAYVDLDDGPRVLTHVEGTDRAPAPGSRVRLVGRTEHGDPLATPVEEAPVVPGAEDGR